MTPIRKAAIAVAALGAAALPLTGATAASAGTNGQQVAVSTYYSDKVQVCGHNQNNAWVCTGYFNTPGTGYTGRAGYWYKGQVTITGVRNSPHQVRTAYCNIPVSQSGDWSYCNGRSNRTL